HYERFTNSHHKWDKCITHYLMKCLFQKAAYLRGMLWLSIPSLLTLFLFLSLLFLSPLSLSRSHSLCLSLVSLLLSLSLSHRSSVLFLPFLFFHLSLCFSGKR